MTDFPSPLEIERLKREKIAMLEEKKALVEGLPFLYAFKDYLWSHQFMHSTNKRAFITAANQIGKSTSQIRRWIHWATSPTKWQQLWGRKPQQFWYLYPTQDIVAIEFENKWAPILPQGKWKDHPLYGWHTEYDGRNLRAIKFNSGVNGYFKTYAQNVQYLQAGTVDYIACDEELPAHLWDEIRARLQGSKGYFSLVFTATLGQEFWRLVMEERGTPKEKFPSAAKWQISLYDCQRYMDGALTQWTNEYIQSIIEECTDEAEVQRRVFGRFVMSTGRKYGGFAFKRNVKPGGAIPRDWFIYAGIDSGSGGKENHPAAIVFVACPPDHSGGRVVASWRGDDIITTSADILEQFVKMKAEFLRRGYQFNQAWYDFADKDISTIALRSNEPLIKANKDHAVGEGTLNTLLKNGTLLLDEEVPDNAKLANEFGSLRHDENKKNAKDDLIDACRYAVAGIPWGPKAFSTTNPEPFTLEAPPKKEEALHESIQRRYQALGIVEASQADLDLLNAEFDAWNSLYLGN